MPALINAKVMEVFRSIQGEGPYIGKAQVFVRFFECNMHCVWCDTPASIGDTSRNYREADPKALAAEVSQLYEGCHSVSITGGEPLLQAGFLVEFLPFLRQRRMVIYLETNGVLPIELARVIHEVDIIAMDIKLPSSTGEKAYWQEHEAFLQHAAQKDVFVKTVISSGTLAEEVMQAAELVKRIAPRAAFIIQPNYFDMKDQSQCIDKCIQLQKKCLTILSDVRMIPQVHKFMKIR